LYSLSVAYETRGYQEPEVKKAKPKIPSCISPVSLMDIDEMIRIISKTGYLVEKRLDGEMRVTAPSCFIDVLILM
jgi:transposase